MTHQELDKDRFAELLAEYVGPYTEAGAMEVIHSVTSVLSVGGGVGLYVTVLEPDKPSVPTNRGYYSVGFTRAKPVPGRLTVNMKHLHDVYTGTDENESTHLVAHYRGEPITYVDVREMIAGHDEFLTGEMRESWFLDVFGPLPPAEIFERGVNVLDMHRYPNYLFGPGYRIVSSTKCRHEYGLTDSCPGCDADEERRTGPWEGVTDEMLGYVS